MELFYFLPSLSLTLRPWTKNKGQKCTSLKYTYFPKASFAIFFYLNGLRVHLLRTQVYSCYGILHHGLLIIGAVSFISAMKSCKIKPKQIPLCLQALGNRRPRQPKIFFLAFPWTKPADLRKKGYILSRTLPLHNELLMKNMPRTKIKDLQHKILLKSVSGFSANVHGRTSKYSRTSIIRNVNHPKRQISEPTFSSFYVQTTKNQRLLHAIKYCVISIKYCILYILYCIVMVALS